MPVATAIAHPNIALCKYWGKRDRALNLPSTPSLSLTLAPFATTTTVRWGAGVDRFVLDGAPGAEGEARKVFAALDRLDPRRPPCEVESVNSFPTAAGLASSASGFAALLLAASSARGDAPDLDELAVHARRASGSATRSLHGGWVEWPLGERADGRDSRGVPLAPAGHWELRMLVAVVVEGRKPTSSTDGMLHTQATSPYYPAWVDAAPADLVAARVAVLSRDLPALGVVMERSALRMHASMFAADPPLSYWRTGSLAVMEAVRELRGAGVGAWFTMDAGPNVKILCAAADVDRVAARVEPLVARVHRLSPGGPARVVG